MVDNLVSVRRYVRAMLAASTRSECLGLILVAGRPSEIDTASPADGGSSFAVALGPYLGVARPVDAGDEGAGVVLPDAGRVLADGLEARCWPGSEAAFREELSAPSPSSWDVGAHTRRGSQTDVATRAAADLASYVGLDARALPAVVVLDPVVRRGVVISLTRGATIWGLGKRMVEEMDGWPHRRLGVVESLVAARMERAWLDHPHDPGIAHLRRQLEVARDEPDDRRRATLTASCHDALREFESLRRPPAGRDDRPGAEEAPAAAADDARRRRAELDGVIVRLRGELEHGDRSVSTADAAVRSATAELGSVRSTALRPPEVLAGWRIERLTPPGVLTRVLGRRRRLAAT